MPATTIDDVIQEFAEIKTFVTDKVASGISPLAEEMERLSASFLSVQEDLKAIRRNNISKMSGNGKIRVGSGKLMGFDALELAMLQSVIRKQYEKLGPDEYRELPIVEQIREARHQIQDQVTPEAIFEWEEHALKERRAAYGYGEFNPGFAKFAHDLVAWRNQLMQIKRKALDSTTAAGGDELVPTLEAAQLWMDVNLETVVLPVLQQVPMPSNPYDLPLQIGDTNWYPAAENIQVTSTTPSTGKTTLTAQGLRAGIPFSDELEEDGIIALVSELRRNLARNAAEVIDDVLLNADQTATNGINSDGAVIATSTAGKAQWLLGWDGLIHLPLVDNTSQGNDHTDTPTAAMFNEILVKLGKYAAPRRRGDVVFVSDVNTAIRSLSIPEFETVDTAGARATLSSGEILSVYGKPYLHAEQMALADTDGKVTDAGNATSTGRLLALNTSQWRVGFRRQITMESEREAGKGQTTLYASFRIALNERSGTRSTATHTALQYNIEGVT